jgi:hypothetical protein
MKETPTPEIQTMARTKPLKWLHPSMHPIEDASLEDIECIDEDKRDSLGLVQFGEKRRLGP